MQLKKLSTLVFCILLFLPIKKSLANCNNGADPIACAQEEAQDMSKISNLDLSNIFLCNQVPRGKSTCDTISNAFRDSVKQNAIKRSACINNSSTCASYNPAPPSVSSIKNSAKKLILEEFYNDSSLFPKTNFSNDACSTLTVTNSEFTCSITSECEVEVNSNWILSCGKKGFLGIGDDGSDDRSDFTGPHCKKNYTDPETWTDDEKSDWSADNQWAQARLKDGQRITQASAGAPLFNQSLSQLKNACKNDDLCKWGSSKGSLIPEDSKCEGKSGGGVEDDVVLQQKIDQAKTKCENFNTDKYWKLNDASTDGDRAESKLERDEICYRTEGCTMAENLADPNNPGEKITGCTVDISSFMGGSDGFQLSEFNAFDTYKGPVFYGPGLRAGARIAKSKLDNTISKERSLQNLILGWTKFALSMTATLAVVALIYAGVLYVTDFGQGSNKEKAQKIIQYVATGIIVILGSYAMVNTLMKARFGNQIEAITYENVQENQSYFNYYLS